MIISVLNLKGGTTKTTSTIALATAAVRDGKAVRVLDADPQSSATSWFYKAMESEEGPLPFQVDPANTTVVKLYGGKETDEWVFIDCPPNGKVLDEAMKAADLVVVPTTSSDIDLEKTRDTVEVLIENGKAYAVLMTCAEVITLNYKKAMSDFKEDGIGFFDSVIRKNMTIVNTYGKPFGKELYGYESVFNEIKEAMEV